MAGGKVEVIGGSGCSRLFGGIASTIPSMKSVRPTEFLLPASTSEAGTPLAAGPFTGLVICVTGLSKEARQQVMAATERLGGHYSSSLHPKCTHLVVQCFGGRKFEHALKHGSKNGLLVVTLGWFVDSVRRSVRLSESLYSVKSVGQSGLPLSELNRLAGLPGAEKSCLPVMAFEDHRPSNTSYLPHPRSPRKESKSNCHVLSNDSIYIDSNISTELKTKVVDAATREGATFLDHWFIGCSASYVVCEGSSIQRYIGHTNCLVTPFWLLKSVKERNLQRLVHISSDLARQVVTILENAQDNCEGNAYPVALNSWRSFTHRQNQESLEERQKTIELAKLGVRNRRLRRMQSCQTPIHPITPGSLLESICWSISEPTSSACIYTELSGTEDDSEHNTSVFFDARGTGRDSDVSVDNFSRPLKESEKVEVIFKNHFLTILFPVDRFGELGPVSRTFFSDGGFSSFQVLDHVYNFYQENMSAAEIGVAIHSDSRHADRLRSLYASKESAEGGGFAPFKRIDFLGSRKCLEALKRVSGENNNNVYELLIRA